MKIKSYCDQIREAMKNQIYHYVMENGQNGENEDDDPSDRPLRTDEGESEGQETETEQQEESL